MVIIIEEKYKSKVDVNNEKNQATSPYVRIQSWRCNLSLSFSAVVLCTVQILSRPKRGRKFQFLINEEKSKKGAGGHVAYVHPKCQSSNWSAFDVEVEVSLADWSGKLGPIGKVISRGFQFRKRNANFGAETDITYAT